MREVRASLPFVVLVAATRGMLGVGIGLLLSERLRRRHRREIAGTLIGIGVASTIPLAIGLFRNTAPAGPPAWTTRRTSRMSRRAAST